MIKDLWLIGIGTGSLSHITAEGMAAIRDAAVILLPEKGEGKDDLADLRRKIITQSDSRARVISFEYPVRDPDLPYADRVSAWHDEIARRWQDALGGTEPTGPVALLVWGDPSLYDSTMRIAQRLAPTPHIRVIPGITAIQALTAAHAIPLNTINGDIRITTGRRLRESGWPEGAETLVVMLDGACSFDGLKDIPGLEIWWGAYLGSPDQLLCKGPLAKVSDQIQTLRGKAREEHGWIMDTYLLRKSPAF